MLALHNDFLEKAIHFSFYHAAQQVCNAKVDYTDKNIVIIVKYLLLDGVNQTIVFCAFHEEEPGQEKA